MVSERTFPVGNEVKFNKFLIKEYFKHGTVEEVVRAHKFDLPISNASYHRLLDSWGVVKTAGPNSRLSEILDFMVRMVEEKVPLERMYKKMPVSFRPSAVTLYRILAYIKEGVTRRVGTAVIVTIKGDDTKVLVARDVSVPRVELGKNHGKLTIPMGFSKINEIRRISVKRLFQQEIFTKDTISNKFPKKIIPKDLKPFLFLDIADVRVEVFHIRLPKKFVNPKLFSSYKLEKYKFVDKDKLLKSRPDTYRVGVVDAVDCYNKYLDFAKRNIKTNPLQRKAKLNYVLAEETLLNN